MWDTMQSAPLYGTMTGFDQSYDPMARTMMGRLNAVNAAEGNQFATPSNSPRQLVANAIFNPYSNAAQQLQPANFTRPQNPTAVSPLLMPDNSSLVQNQQGAREADQMMQRGAQEGMTPVKLQRGRIGRAFDQAKGALKSAVKAYAGASVGGAAGGQAGADLGQGIATGDTLGGAMKATGFGNTGMGKAVSGQLYEDYLNKYSPNYVKQYLQ